MQLAFTKMHGLGNDFVVVEDLAAEIDFSPEAIRWFCDRNFGVGADGLILIRPATTPDADYLMLYFNADGSAAEMCGNGIRCFTKYLVDHGILSDKVDSIVVETLGGTRPISFTRDYDGTMHLATVDMGVPALAPGDIPTTLPGEQVFECPLETPFGTFQITAVSMGNPHIVIWVDDIDDAPVETVGPYIETHESFPDRTNVEFAQFLGDDTIALRVWERGVGETLACGTGACATLVAASLSCLVGRTATVRLPGGELDIRWDEGGHVYMTGPATQVFLGTIELPEDDA